VKVLVRTMCGQKKEVFVSRDYDMFKFIDILVDLELASSGCGLLICRSDKTFKLENTTSLAKQGVVANDEVLVVRPLPNRQYPIFDDVKFQLPTKDEYVVGEKEIAEQTVDVPASDPQTRTGITVEPSQSSHATSIIPFDVVSNLYKISKTLRAALEDNDDDGSGPNSTDNDQDGGNNDDEEEEEELDPYKDVDAEALQMMLAMGFQEERSKKALVLNGNQVEASMEWLINHEGDVDIDTPLPPPPKALKTNAGTTFTPCPASHRTLMTMGFVDRDIVAALQLARNNISAAMDHLLSGVDVHKALEERDQKSMDMNSPIMKEVLKDAHVQARLVEPRVWKALESFHENPQKGSQYLSDPVIGSIIMFLSQLIKRVESNN